MVAAVVSSGSIAAEGTNVTTRSFTLGTVANGDYLAVGIGLASSGTVTLTGAGVSAAAPTVSTTRSGFGAHAWLLPLTAAHSGTSVTITTASTLKVATNWVVLRGITGLSGSGAGTNGTSANPMTPPVFTPAASVALVQVASMGTAGNPPPTSWTAPSPMTVQVFSGTGGTTGRAGSAIGILTAENTAISGDWTASTTNSWGILSLPVAVAASESESHSGGSSSTIKVTAGQSGHAWADQGATDALLSPTPTTSTVQGSGAQTAGSTLVAPNDARLRYRGASGFAYGTGTPDSSCYHPNSRYPYGWGNPGTWGVEFDHTGNSFEVLYKYLSATGAGWFRISADGQRVTDAPVKPAGGSGGSMHTHRVTFATAATRRILLEFQGVPFGGIYLPPGASIANPGAFTRRAVFEGDSITAGSDENSGAGAGTWFARYARYAGIDDPWNVAIGGTGMIAPGTATTIPGRIAQVTSVPSPTDIYLWCGGNDGSTSIVNEATTYIADIKAAHPNANLYVIGTWSPAVTAPASRAARSIDLQNAAAANAVPFISPITGEVRDATGTVVASQGAWISTSGQVAAYVSSNDNVHPTDAGHVYIAQRMAQAVAALPSTNGTKGVAQGSSADVTIAATGSGTKAASAGSTADIGVTSNGVGAKHSSGGSVATLDVTTLSSGMKNATGGSTIDVALSTSGTGTAGRAGGSTTDLSVDSVGQGVSGRSGGSATDVLIEAVGSGHVDNPGSGGSVSLIEVASVGSGAKHAAGGSVATLDIVTIAAGIAARSGGSVATIALEAVGSGYVPGAARDITITLGPPVPARTLTLGTPARRPLAIGTPRRTP